MIFNKFEYQIELKKNIRKTYNANAKMIKKCYFIIIKIYVNKFLN